MIGELQVRLEIRSDREAEVTLTGELDIAHVDRLRRTLRAMLASGRHLTIDASQLDFIDGTGLTTLLLAHREARARDLTVRLVAASAPVERLLDLTGARHLLGPPPTTREGRDRPTAMFRRFAPG